MEVDNIDKENLESASNHTVDLTDENKDAETNELNDNQKTPKSKITESAKKRRAESQVEFKHLLLKIFKLFRILS